MKLNELDVKAQKKILIFGNSGTGKTCFGGSFPAPVFIADFDGKVSSARAYFSDKTEQLNGIEYESFVPKPGEEPSQPFEHYCRKLHELEQAAAKKEFPYKTVVLDSLTTYTDQMLKSVMKQNPGIKRVISSTTKIPSMQDYGILTLHFKDMLCRLLQLPCHVIVTAHVKTDKDELTGEVLRNPLLPGKLSDYLPVLFEEVYHSDVEGEGANRKYKLQTQADYRVKCRSQLRNIPAKVETSYGELSKYF